MNWTISYKTAVALATVSLFCSVARAADDDDDATEPAEAPAAAAKAEAAEEELVPQKVEKPFWFLMRCKRIDAGAVKVQVPRSKDWVPAQEGRYYPYGTIVRAETLERVAPQVIFEFGDKSFVTITNDAEFATKEIKIGETSRTLLLRAGHIDLNLPRTLKDGFFKVEAPSFTCSNLAGESAYDYTPDADGHVAVVRCVTGTIALEGPHYKFSHLAAANQLRVSAKNDGSYTELTGLRGDCKAVLDMGLVAEKDFDTGEMKEHPQSLNFSLSPKCVIKIFRAKAAVGGRTIVSMMTFDAAEIMKNRFAYAEKRSNINSGELVVSAKTKAAAAANAAGDAVTEAVAAPVPAAVEEPKPAKADDDKKADDAGDDDAPADDKKADDDKKDDAADDKKADDKKGDDDDFI